MAKENRTIKMAMYLLIKVIKVMFPEVRLVVVIVRGMHFHHLLINFNFLMKTWLLLRIMNL